jgi:hypothetical protein
MNDDNDLIDQATIDDTGENTFDGDAPEGSSFDIDKNGISMGLKPMTDSKDNPRDLEEEPVANDNDEAVQ